MEKRAGQTGSGRVVARVSAPPAGRPRRRAPRAGRRAHRRSCPAPSSAGGAARHRLLPRCAAARGSCAACHQRTQPGGVDEGDGRKIDHEAVRACRQQLLYGLAQAPARVQVQLACQHHQAYAVTNAPGVAPELVQRRPPTVRRGSTGALAMKRTTTLRLSQSPATSAIVPASLRWSVRWICTPRGSCAALSTRPTGAASRTTLWSIVVEASRRYCACGRAVVG